jgi:proline iminopeptidase
VSAARSRSKRTVRKPARRKTVSTKRRTLYPPIEPFNSGYLKVSDLHEIYFEESGNPRGKPAVFLHGGPGAGTDPKMRRFFDPRRYRIVLLDQRGSGKSRPHASLFENTTWDLVADLEKLRAHLKIDRWLVFGGSWGSTLALAYSQTHPKRCTEIVLRGIFLVRRWELDWFYQDVGGAAALYPDLWEEFVAPIPESERGDMMSAFYRRLVSDDPTELSRAAKAWSIWEGATSFLHQNPEHIEHAGEDVFAAALARIECHYFVNRGFLRSENELIENAHRLKKIPAVIVQGRYDIVCPMRSAWDLHRAWPEADLRIVPDAGHSAFEKGITSELVSATDRFAKSRSR